MIFDKTEYLVNEHNQESNVQQYFYLLLDPLPTSHQFNPKTVMHSRQVITSILEKQKPNA